MLSLLFHSLFAFMKYMAIGLYMVSIILFIIYGIVFVEAMREGLIR